jgi:hypothetical protein
MTKVGKILTLIFNFLSFSELWIQKKETKKAKGQKVRKKERERERKKERKRERKNEDEDSKRKISMTFWQNSRRTIKKSREKAKK